MLSKWLSFSFLFLFSSFCFHSLSIDHRHSSFLQLFGSNETFLPFFLLFLLLDSFTFSYLPLPSSHGKGIRFWEFSFCFNRFGLVFQSKSLYPRRAISLSPILHFAIYPQKHTFPNAEPLQIPSKKRPKSCIYEFRKQISLPNALFFAFL